ncbi:uncharacterized protein [Littorina saxatilis]|uniref:Cysteine and tyrosine-rich protein 1 n=1 Tax=Littorina saxatilis TaxID=31220 RepID=A0AAN9GC64_9CAEN
MADSLSFLGIPALCFFFALIKDALGGEYCYMGRSFSVKYCRYGCCGSSIDRSCCNLGVGMIVGGVVAAIACISIVVTVVCCCVKKQTYRGRVVGPHANNVTVVHTNTQGMAQGMANPGPYNQHPRPMGYPQPAPYMYPGPNGYKPPPPPPYLYANPAYPPGAAPGGGVGGGGGFAAPAAPAYAPNS